MQYLQVALLLLALLALGAILIGVVRNVRGPHKGKYQTTWSERKKNI
ncbi:MAG: hypothetical protein ABI778_04645 [Ignavibacteriota bacterium]